MLNFIYLALIYFSAFLLLWIIIGTIGKTLFKTKISKLDKFFKVWVAVGFTVTLLFMLIVGVRFAVCLGQLMS